MRSSQATLQGFSYSNKLSFGGSKLKSNPKSARPISTKAAIHIVMRSTFAKGQRSFLLHSKSVENIFKTQAKKCGVNLYDLSNAGNLLHLVIRVPSRRLYLRFIRASSGLIARRVLGKERKRSCTTARGYTSGGSGVRDAYEISSRRRVKFWEGRPFTRIVSWGKEYKILKNYLMINRIETIGMDRVSVRRMLKKIEEFKIKHGLIPTGFG